MRKNLHSGSYQVPSFDPLNKYCVRNSRQNSLAGYHAGNQPHFTVTIDFEQIVDVNVVHIIIYHGIVRQLLQPHHIAVVEAEYAYGRLTTTVSVTRLLIVPFDRIFLNFISGNYPR